MSFQKFESFVSSQKSCVLAKTIAEKYPFALESISTILRVEIDKFRRYIACADLSVAKNIIAFVHDELNLECHEVMFPCQYSRVFFDIDMKLRVIDRTELKDAFGDLTGVCTALGNLLNELLDVTLALHFDCDLDNDLTFTYDTRNRKIDANIFKISMHWFSNTFTVGPAYTKSIVTKVIELIKSEVTSYEHDSKFAVLSSDNADDKFKILQHLGNAIDTAPYTTHGSLALTGGNKGRFKLETDDTFSKLRDNGYVWRNKRGELTYNEEVIEFELEGVVKRNVGPIDSEFIRRVVDSLNDQSFFKGFSWTGKQKGSFLEMQRDVSTHCSVCDRSHDKDNTLVVMLYEDTKTAYWKCRRSSSKTKLFYKEEQSDTESVASSKSIKKTKKQIEASMDDAKEEVFKRVITHAKTVSKESIREDNGIDIDAIIMSDDSHTPEQLATLILQTIVRVENSADPMYFVKTISDRKYKREYVSTIKYEPREGGNLKKYNIPVELNESQIYINLLDAVTMIKSCIQYKKVVLEPYGRRCFNLFPGFIHKHDVDFVPDERVVSVWTDHLRQVLSNGDDNVYQYLLCYFKYFLVNPMEKTGVVLIVKGKQGSGKNSPFDVFYRYVLGPSLSLTTSSMDLIAGRFNSIRESMICCCLGEAVDNGDRATMNKFKNLITSDEVQIERKGQEPITFNDYCNYVIISNGDFASFIEESDRRSLCLETNSEFIGNRKYFNDFHKTLNNVDAGKHIFHWLINSVHTPQNWHPQDIPRTEYKQELKRAQASTPIKYLLHRLEQLDDANNDDECEVANGQFFSDYCEFCDRNKIKAVSANAFTKLTKPHVEKRVSNSVRYNPYSRLSLKESLSAYL